MTYQRHPLEIGPLVFGLIFLGIVTAWGLFELDVVTGADTAWILPIVLIAAGALGVALAATRSRRAEPPGHEMYAPTPYARTPYAPTPADDDLVTDTGHDTDQMTDPHDTSSTDSDTRKQNDD
jgi:hypothetical protein